MTQHSWALGASGRKASGASARHGELCGWRRGRGAAPGGSAASAGDGNGGTLSALPPGNGALAVTVPPAAVPVPPPSGQTARLQCSAWS